MGFSLKSVRFILTVHTLFIIGFCTFSHWTNGYFSRFFGYFKPFLGFSRLFYILYYACQITVSSVADAMSLTMQSGFDMKFDGISGAMLDGGSGGVVNNYYNNDNSRTVNQTNNSPKSLSRLEIYRQTRNALNV